MTSQNIFVDNLVKSESRSSEWQPVDVNSSANNADPSSSSVVMGLRTSPSGPAVHPVKNPTHDSLLVGMGAVRSADGMISSGGSGAIPSSVLNAVSSGASGVIPATGLMNSGVSGAVPVSGLNSGVTNAISENPSISMVMRFGNLEETEISSRYEVGAQVGRGASAIVYEAWRLEDRLHVVIKLLQVGALEEEEAHTAIKRFYREAELITKLKEEHIVQCVDYGRFNGTPCMVLEYVDGLSLDKFLAQYGAIPLAYSTNIIEQLLLALQETHSQGVIHRDIKPGNIMVFDSPPPYTIRVLDFGISSVLEGFTSKTLMTQTGNVRGTPSYMAPELFTGESRASIESDLYAVGLVYLECLTGEVAVSDKSFMRVAYKQVNEAIEVPGYVPPDIANIIIKLCAKPVKDRYHSASVVLDDIRKVLPKALEEEEKCLKEWKRSNHKLYRKGNTVSAAVIELNKEDGGSSKLKYIVAAAGVLILVGVLLVVIGNLNKKNHQIDHLNDQIVDITNSENNKNDDNPVVENPEDANLSLTQKTINSGSDKVATSWAGAVAAVQLKQNDGSTGTSKTPTTQHNKNKNKRTPDSNELVDVWKKKDSGTNKNGSKNNNTRTRNKTNGGKNGLF